MRTITAVSYNIHSAVGRDGRSVRVVQSELTLTASDHLPLLAAVRLGS